jgi:pimeloyl-ACP methyl ester carboxylesterase
MRAFPAADGTRLGYHVQGSGAPLICVPGGPMRASSYLGDLGGLAAHRRVILLDLRGTGDSAVPADPATYRCDRLAGDITALRRHLGLDRFDLLGHSAGANIAVAYAITHPEQVRSLVLITPSGRAAGLEPDTEMRRQVVRQRPDAPWLAAASAAFERVADGSATDDDWIALAPLFYGRWDDAARAHDEAGEAETNDAAAAAFGADGAFNPAATRAALGTLPMPVLVLGGGLDLQRPPEITAAFAGLFPAAALVIQPGAGHYPWLDDPGQFSAVVTTFLDEGR